MPPPGQGTTPREVAVSEKDHDDLCPYQRGVERVEQARPAGRLRAAAGCGLGTGRKRQAVSRGRRRGRSEAEETGRRVRPIGWPRSIWSPDGAPPASVVLGALSTLGEAGEPLAGIGGMTLDAGFHHLVGVKDRELGIPGFCRSRELARRLMESGVEGLEPRRQDSLQLRALLRRGGALRILGWHFSGGGGYSGGTSRADTRVALLGQILGWHFSGQRSGYSGGTSRGRYSGGTSRAHFSGHFSGPPTHRSGDRKACRP